MNAFQRLQAACRAVALDLHCECEHTEPRFKAELDHSGSSPRLFLRLRNDDTIMPAALHHDPAVPGLLFEIVEETVQREPVLKLWLPHTARHRFVVWRNCEGWMIDALPEYVPVETVAAAVAMVTGRAAGSA